MKELGLLLVFIATTFLVVPSVYAANCLVCHTGGVPPDPPAERNCLASGCHDVFDNGNHHTTGQAIAGMCIVCHDFNLVADYNDENPLSYPASMVTPTVGSCSNCHKADPSADPFPIYQTAQLEHMGGQGHAGDCNLCHDNDPPDDYDIRCCETCHSSDKIHSNPGHIQDSYGYDENGVWGLIEANDKCNACHWDIPTMLYVPQDTGLYDTGFSELSETDCRVCHGSNTAPRHHTLEDCEDPLFSPVINTTDCGGLTPIVGTRMARVSISGTDFGSDQQLPLCGHYTVQMKGGETWEDLNVTFWGETLVNWSLPRGLFAPYQYHEIQVQTPTGQSNPRSFFVLPAPDVDYIEDNTGGDTQGPLFGQIEIHSKSMGTFSDNRQTWYEDALGGTCPNYFGAIYVVTVTDGGRNYCATIYEAWGKQSVKVALNNFYDDVDGDYYQDANEPISSNSDVPLGTYSVQVCLVIYADSNGDGGYSGNDEDTVYQVVKSSSEVTYEINNDLFCECSMVPDSGAVIPRGGVIGFQATVTNNTNLAGTVHFATKLYKIQGPPYGTYPPSGFLDGPFNVQLDPYGFESGHISHTIPAGWPTGVYTYRGWVGQLSGLIYDSCEFEFEVTEP